MKEIEKAIAYFEDAIRESDEIIAECSKELQKELTEQKGHFVIALEAMHEKQEREKGCEYCNTNALISFKYKEAGGNTEFYFANYCPMCGRRS